LPSPLLKRLTGIATWRSPRPRPPPTPIMAYETELSGAII
jgi:hypothetical protein